MDREVGYCQGSAFIVGLLLMQVKMILIMCEPSKSLLDSSGLLGVLVIVFITLLAMELPKAAVSSAIQKIFTLCGFICQEDSIFEWENTYISFASYFGEHCFNY